MTRHEPWNDDEGYEFDYDELTLQVYELLCMFLASKALAQIPGPDKGFTTLVTTRKYRRALEAVQERHFRANVHHSILSVAGMLRIIEERNHRELPNQSQINCGLLFEPLDSSERTSEFRESCNKIIHAKRIEFMTGKGTLTVGQRQVEDSEYYEPHLLLFGTKRRQKWKAQLDIIEFCRASLEMAELN